MSFQQFIKEEIETIQYFKESLKEGNLSNDRIPSVKYAIFLSYIQKTIAMYSAAYDKKAITQSVLETISAFVEGFKWRGIEQYGGYEKVVWLLSLAILCEVPDEAFEDIVKILERDNAKDRLLKTLVNYRFPNRLSSGSKNYLQPLPYADLDTVVIGNNKSAASIKQYLDKKWYQAMDEEAWYDSHKNTKVNTYFGYWAWETAALAKINGIDDKSLEHQQYYPYRAVHW